MALKSRLICIASCQEVGQSSLGTRRIFHQLKNFRRHFVHKELTNQPISWILTFVRGFTICSCAGRDLSKSGKWSLPAELLDAATSLPYISLDGYGVHTAPVKQAKICNWPWFWRWIVQNFERLGVEIVVWLKWFRNNWTLESQFFSVLNVNECSDLKTV